MSDINSLIMNFGKFISDSAVSIFNVAIEIITNGIISFIVGIYFLADMENIRFKLKNFLKNRDKRTYNYVKTLDHEVGQYFVGLVKFIFIQLIEYTTIFYFIGHPYFLILGILASFTTVIPYFGGIFANIVAVLAALVFDFKLAIRTLIVALICPNIDGYIISPKIYGKTNKMPALLSIFAVFAGGKLFGIMGIIIALPTTIILVATYRFYKNEIYDKIDDIKERL